LEDNIKIDVKEVRREGENVIGTIDGLLWTRYGECKRRSSSWLTTVISSRRTILHCNVMELIILRLSVIKTSNLI
jgi:hypothetical protein